jgi:hypothetical protein
MGSRHHYFYEKTESWRGQWEKIESTTTEQKIPVGFYFSYQSPPNRQEPQKVLLVTK